MSNEVNVGMPKRPSTEKINQVPIFFVTPEFAKIIKAASIDLLSSDAYELIRKYAAPVDIAFNFEIDRKLSDSLLFKNLGDCMNLRSTVSGSNKKDSQELVNLVYPLIDGEENQKEVLHYLGGGGKLSYLNQEDEPYYELSFSKGSLLVGVKPNFANYFDNPDTVGKFYRNCLEMCQASVVGSDLRFSSLFAKFVKHVVYF